MAKFWQGFGWVLAIDFIYALGVAWLTRYLDEKKVEGQTYSLVVLGVAGVVIVAGSWIGWVEVARLAVAFAVAAVPMGVEYYQRVVIDKDIEVIAMKEMVDGNSGKGREARVQGCNCGRSRGYGRGADAVEEGDAGKQE